LSTIAIAIAMKPDHKRHRYARKEKKEKEDGLRKKDADITNAINHKEKKNHEAREDYNYCLHPSITLVCRLLLRAFAIAALDRLVAFGGACVGVAVEDSPFSGTEAGVVAAAAAMPSLLSARREPLLAVLVRGSLLFAAADAEVKLPAGDEAAAGILLALRLLP
jgi:hypothetical protein